MSVIDVHGDDALGIGPIERSAMNKIIRRIIPFLVFCYFILHLDRINVGMAAITMNKSIGLDIDGLFGLCGWQWLFIVEAQPAVILGFVVLRYLTDRPKDAAWLGSGQCAGSAVRRPQPLGRFLYKRNAKKSTLTMSFGELRFCDRDAASS